MSELIAFCLIVYATGFALTVAFTIVGVVCILAKAALCALWRKVSP